MKGEKALAHAHIEGLGAEIVESNFGVFTQEVNNDLIHPWSQAS